MSNSTQLVRFCTYSQFHGKDKPVGSDYLRAHQLIKYWPEAGLYHYGENPEVLIFQKVFILPDWTWPKDFEGIKILDICDPMWFEEAPVVEMAQHMAALTCPTERMAEFLKQFHDNVVVIPDRFDIALIGKPKQHTKRAKTVVWYGYSHNAELLKPAMALIEQLGLKLIVLSNDDPIPDRWGSRKRSEYYTFKKYNEDTIYDDLKQADFAILPEGNRPEDPFKSNNKTIRANLAGLPVARIGDEVRAYMEPSARRLWFDNNYAKIKKEYDVKLSIEQYEELIGKLSED